VSVKINLFSPWYSRKISKLKLNNNRSLAHYKYIYIYILYKYSMWLWSIYKHIFSRYLELHGCVLLPDTPQRRPPPRAIVV
jgi:hypothetical protein